MPISTRYDPVVHIGDPAEGPPSVRPGDQIFDAGRNTLKVVGLDGNARGVTGAIAATNLTHASVASNGAGAVIGNLGAQNFRAPQDLTIVSAWWEPTGADSSCSQAASYRRLTLINAGSNGATGNTALGSLNNNTSQASNTTKGFTLGANPTVAAGNVIAVSHATVGGADANGTVLVAGQVGFTYRPL